jgi:Na+/phosphate symporter
VREQQDKFYTATTGDIIKGAITTFVGGLLAGVAALLLVGFLGGFLFIGFLAAFFLGPALGGGVAEAARRFMGKRHARNFPLIGTLILVVSMLIILIPVGALMWSWIDIGMALLVLFLAASTFYARLKF